MREDLRRKHVRKIKQRVEESVFSHTIKCKSFGISDEDEPLELYQRMADVRRRDYFGELFGDMPVEDLSRFKSDCTPVLIEENYELESSDKLKDADSYKKDFGQAEESKQGSYHLFILVHGFQAGPHDMREIKNEIAMVVPNAVFFTSQANAGKKTRDNIELVGKRLAIEVQDYLEEEAQEDQLEFTRISFIGHSMGGIFIRAALPRLEKYRPLFYSYCSLSSPHLGYSFHKSAIITTGIWFMQKFTDCMSLKQMQMRDYEDPKKCYLYRLSFQPGLAWFKNVFLFSSVQDNWA